MTEMLRNRVHDWSDGSRFLVSGSCNAGMNN
jgi:hypothetical protein